MKSEMRALIVRTLSVRLSVRSGCQYGVPLSIAAPAWDSRPALSTHPECPSGGRSPSRCRGNVGVSVGVSVLSSIVRLPRLVPLD